MSVLEALEYNLKVAVKYVEEMLGMSRYFLSIFVTLLGIPGLEIEDVPIDDILSCMVIKDYYND